VINNSQCEKRPPGLVPGGRFAIQIPVDRRRTSKVGCIHE